jgi:hypothetical protein
MNLRDWFQGALILFAAVTPLQARAQTVPAAPSVESPPDKPPAIQVRAKFGEGATIATKDDKVTLTLRARIQTQALFATNPDDADDPRTEFLVRRMRLEVKGNIIGEQLTYRVQLGFSNRDTEPDLRLPLRDAFLNWRAHRLLQLRFGQMKVPVGRQRVNSSSALETVDRSIVVGELNLDRDVGLYMHSNDLVGTDGLLGYAIGVFGGDGRNRVNEHGGLLYAAQLSVAPLGRFDDLSEGDLRRGSKPRVLFSVGGAFNQNTNRAQSTLGNTYTLSGFDYLHASVAAIFKFRGFSANGEFLYRRATEASHTGIPSAGKAAVTEYARSARGYFVQASQMMGPHWQAVARLGEYAPIGISDPKLTRSRELGGGLNYYFAEHNLKIQADYFYLYGSDFSDGRHQARVQVQAYF